MKYWNSSIMDLLIVDNDNDNNDINYIIYSMVQRKSLI